MEGSYSKYEVEEEKPKFGMRRRHSINVIVSSKKKSTNMQKLKKKLKCTFSTLTNEMSSALSTIVKPKTATDLSSMLLSQNNLENHNSNVSPELSQLTTSSVKSESSDSGISNAMISEKCYDSEKVKLEESNPENDSDETETDCKEEIPIIQDKRKKLRDENGDIILEEIIEDVWDVCIKKVDNDYKMMFLVKWDNWAPADNTFEPYEHVYHADCLLDYVRRKFEFHSDRIESAIFNLCLSEKELQENMEKKSKNYILKKLEHFDLLHFKCCILAYLYTYEPVPKTCNFMRKLISKCFMYRELIKKEKQEETHAKLINSIQSVDGNVTLKIENKIDFSIMPAFQYVSKVEDSNRQVTDLGCKCGNGCYKSTECCANLMGVTPALDKLGELSAKTHQMIVECGENCSCDMKICTNHVQKRKLSFAVFKTEGRGWGLRTLEYIPAGSYVIEYTGEVVDAENAKMRTRMYKKKGIVDQYLFDLDYNDSNEAFFVLDATQKGNLSRFINHSCSPNLQTWPACHLGEDKNKHRLYYFSLRGIRTNEELTVDYSGGIIGGNMPKKIPKNAKECRCQAPNCRGFIF